MRKVLNLGPSISSEGNKQRSPLRNISNARPTKLSTFERCAAFGAKRTLFGDSQKEFLQVLDEPSGSQLQYHTSGINPPLPKRPKVCSPLENINYDVSYLKNAGISTLAEDFEKQDNITPEDLANCRQIARCVLSHMEVDEGDKSFLDELPKKFTIQPPYGHIEPLEGNLSSEGPELCTLQENTNLIKELENRLSLYIKQFKDCSGRGAKSSAKRKLKRISLYKSIIENAKLGMDVDLTKLPNPSLSPISSKSQISTKVNQEVLTEESHGQVSESCRLKVLITESQKSQQSNPDTASNCDGDDEKKKSSLGRKYNYCLVCKKLIKEFCKHFEKVHKNTDEGKKLQEVNLIQDPKERKRLKTEITDVLRKKGNAEYSRTQIGDQFIKGHDAIVVPVKRGKNLNFTQKNCVQCAHCEGFYIRRKFTQHLNHCKQFLNESGKNGTKQNSLPVIVSVEGASKELMEEVVSSMLPRDIKDFALRDPLIMKYASEFHKSRRHSFQRNYVSRIILDLARLLKRMQESLGEKITCLEDVFNPVYFSNLVECILQEGGYDATSGTVSKCGISNRLRSHIKGAAQCAEHHAKVAEILNYDENSIKKRKSIKHFLDALEKKWANEAGRIFDFAAKQSLAENRKKLAAEEDIVKTCQYITSQYRNTTKDLEKALPNSNEKVNNYNKLVDLLVTHIMCLIRRRPVDFKRAKNHHYDKFDKQDSLIDEVKNSEHMNITEEDLKICQKFTIFYVPGKGWKEMVPMALTTIMKEAMDAIQRNKINVGITKDLLFIRAKNLDINPRECIRKVTKGLKLKRPLDLSGNGLRHHAGTFSKLHSSHPQYQDYLASALGHTLHVHKMHYEMPTSILQKLIVCPVLENLTKPVEQRDKQGDGGDVAINESCAFEHESYEGNDLEEGSNKCKSIDYTKKNSEGVNGNVAPLHSTPPKLNIPSLSSNESEVSSSDSEIT